MHALACEALLPHLHPGARVLDIGSGSGYLTHVLAELVKPGGKVVGVDHIQPLVDMALQNTSKSEEGRDLLRNGGIEFVKGDGRKGYAKGAPYDAIHVGAAAKGWQAELETQLRAPGRMFVPVEEQEGDALQYIYVVDKGEDGTVTRRKDIGVRYVPLTDAPVG